MIMKFDFEDRNLREIEPLIGKRLSLSQKIAYDKYGGNLYNLLKLSTETDLTADIPSVNARCNFEKFEKGILLRINDNQKLYGLPLSRDLITGIELKKGDEIIYPISLTGFLLLIGMKKETIKKHKILSGGFQNKRFQLKIKTKTEEILLDSNPGNYKTEKKYFKGSDLEPRLSIKE